jgi:hypothetical protein
MALHVETYLPKEKTPEPMGGQVCKRDPRLRLLCKSKVWMGLARCHGMSLG